MGILSGFASLFSKTIKDPVTGKESEFYPIGFSRGWNFNRESLQDILEFGYLGNDSVFSVIRKIALNGSTLPILIKNKAGKEVTSGKYWDITENPNERQSKQQYRYSAIVSIASAGELFILKDVESVGFPYRKKILPPQFVTVVKQDNYSLSSPIIRYDFNDGGEIISYKPEEIIYIRDFDPSDYGLTNERGLSPLQAGAYIVHANNNLTIAESVTLENRGINNIIAAKDPSGLEKKDKEKLDRGLLNRMGGPEKFNASIFTNAPIDVHSIGMTSQDMELVKTFPNQLRRICNLWSVPAELFNADKSGQFNTRKEALRSFYTEAVIPIVENILAAEDMTIGKDFSGGNEYQEIDRSKIEALNPDKQEQDKTYLTMYEKGAISRQAFLTLTNIEDDGETFVRQTGNQAGAQQTGS